MGLASAGARSAPARPHSGESLPPPPSHDAVTRPLGQAGGCLLEPCRHSQLLMFSTRGRARKFNARS
eukprot:2581637-Alexandrium_andersonii.AAC.1